MSTLTNSRRPANMVRRETVLHQALRSCRRHFIMVGVFSLIINVLQLTTSLYMLQVYDRVLASHSADTLLFLTLITIAALLLLGFLDAARGLILQRVSAWLEEKASPEGFARAIEAQLGNGSYRMEVLRDLGSLRSFLSSPAMSALYDVPWVPVYLFVIFMLHPLLGWVATAGAIALFVLAVANETLTTAHLRKSATIATAIQRRNDAIVRNAEVIDSMGMLPAVLKRWHAAVAVGLADNRIASDRATLVLATTRFVRLAVQVAILGMGALAVLRSEMTAGAMIAASIIMGRSLAPVEQMISGWRSLVSARSAWRRMTAFFSAPRLRPPGLPLTSPLGRLTAEHLTYTFPGRNAPTLQNVSFALEPATCMAVVGPSAAGKTTLVRLLTGTMRPAYGSVRLDGADVFNWQREDFGKYVGYLPQDVELFEGTVFDNIARLQSVNPRQVYEAAQLAGCHEMILQLPHGYESEIGEAGTYLSGG